MFTDFNRQNYCNDVVFKIPATGWFSKFSTIFANFILDIIIKYILRKKNNNNNKRNLYVLELKVHTISQEILTEISLQGGRALFVTKFRIHVTSHSGTSYRISRSDSTLFQKFFFFHRYTVYKHVHDSLLRRPTRDMLQIKKIAANL